MPGFELAAIMKREDPATHLSRSTSAASARFRMVRAWEPAAFVVKLTARVAAKFGYSTFRGNVDTRLRKLNPANSPPSSSQQLALRD